jgi:MFS transporter, PAT family, beta-lactamase induction signal transducer AmpG
MSAPGPDHIDAPGSDRAWVFGLLIAPYGVLLQGIVQGGVLGYLLSRQGTGSAMQAHLIGLLSLPTSLYFLWSPITDFFVRRRTWLLGSALTAASLIWLSFQQPRLSSTGVVSLAFLAACCGQLVVSSAGGMMGALHSERTRRVASGLYQAGAMGFGAVSAWALIYLSERVSRDSLALAAAALIAAPALAVFAAPRQTHITGRSFRATMRLVRGEFKITFFRREALPYIACMIFPIGTGAAIGLLPGVARQYGVDGDQVAWINGLAGGLLTAGGAWVMSLIRTRINVPVRYMMIALVNCMCLSVLWLGPVRPQTYYVGVLLYLFTVGCCYATFTAVVLEFLGKSGKSGSARYSIINSLGNIPVLYMLQLDGWGGEHWGGRGLAGAEALATGMAALTLLTWLLMRNPARVPQVSEQAVVFE